MHLDYLHPAVCPSHPALPCPSPTGLSQNNMFSMLCLKGEGRKTSKYFSSYLVCPNEKAPIKKRNAEAFQKHPGVCLDRFIIQSNVYCFLGLLSVELFCV